MANEVCRKRVRTTSSHDPDNEVSRKRVRSTCQDDEDLTQPLPGRPLFASAKGKSSTATALNTGSSNKAHPGRLPVPRSTTLTATATPTGKQRTITKRFAARPPKTNNAPIAKAQARKKVGTGPTDLDDQPLPNQSPQFLSDGDDNEESDDEDERVYKAEGALEWSVRACLPADIIRSTDDIQIASTAIKYPADCTNNFMPFVHENEDALRDYLNARKIVADEAYDERTRRLEYETAARQQEETAQGH